ncbi:hypothetical protein [Brevundimonas aurifodinae]|uniref:Uncharacterized protein n=1 Tax=Brevundimonas aurifodinae TaxID=1508312 RepID=A0ABV1NLW6_9CAUL
MTGYQDRPGRPPAGDDDWALQRKANQRRLIEAAEARLLNETIADDDAVAADRHVRAITNLAKAVVAVEAIRPPRPTRADQENEEDMGRRQDDDPAVVAALRAELRERYDLLEAKRELRSRADGVGSGGASEGEGLEPQPWGPSGAADDGLAHLADAWGTGRGQDLRRGLLAA